MENIEEYVARIEKPCGLGRDFIVVFKPEKSEKATSRILKNAQMKKSISPIILELTFRDVPFRLYKNGKAIFRNLGNEKKLRSILLELLTC